MSLYDKTVETLQKGWHSTRSLVIEAGISADRYRRSIPNVIKRTVVKHGKKVKEYSLPVQMGLF